MEFVGYSTYASLVICAVFSILIFWKLCQIQKQLPGRPQSPYSPKSPPEKLAAHDLRPPPATPQIGQDDSRYLPKK